MVHRNKALRSGRTSPTVLITPERYRRRILGLQVSWFAISRFGSANALWPVSVPPSLKLAMDVLPVRIGPGTLDGSWIGTSGPLSAALSIPSGNGHEKPATVAGLTYARTVLWVMPSGPVITRWPAPELVR